MKLIALCGAAGAGKDTVADMLPYPKLAFADLLYDEVALDFGVEVSMLKDRRNKETPQKWLGSLSPREALQLWGDYRRDVDPDYFVKAMEARLCNESRYVITDVRFKNEADMVRSLGGLIIQVVRPGVSAGHTGHASDTAGDEFYPDGIICNDGSLEDLKGKCMKYSWR